MVIPNVLWTTRKTSELNLTETEHKASLVSLGLILPRYYITIPGAQLAKPGIAYWWEYAMSTTQALVMPATAESDTFGSLTKIVFVNCNNVGSMILSLNSSTDCRGRVIGHVKMSGSVVVRSHA
jgi:hypothetical protein